MLGKNGWLTSRRTTLKGGIGGGLAGLAFGAVGVYAAGARFPAFRQLTVPLRAFLITSAGTFSGMSAHIYSDKIKRRELAALGREVRLIVGALFAYLDQVQVKHAGSLISSKF